MTLPTKRTVPALLAAARVTLMKRPVVWLPPFMISALQLMASGPYSNDMAQLTVLVTSTLGAFIIEAGWLALIRDAMKDGPVQLDAFQSGVNAHWAALVFGNAMFYMILAALFAGFYALGSARYGVSGLEDWLHALKALPPDRMEAALRIDQVPLVVQNWLTLLMGWLALASVLGFLLLFWEPVVVLRDVGWLRGWLGSARIVLARFPQAIAIALLHGMLMFAALVVLTAGSPVAALLGLMMLLSIMTYFKVLYATLVADALAMAEMPSPAVDARV